ncbi:MAG: polyribonucleotide nucleotidyltransferase [Spirochaetes bacterium]|nr:polyribonucleotide nucleotidyltransferase [Spirochaetota bacterium]
MPKITIPIGDKELVLETGKVAKQASGAVWATYEGAAVLATVCYSEDEIEGLDYVPLQVEYNEKHYAAGKIPGGFLKREGKPKDKEILVSRLIDRPMRPLFHKEFSRDIQLIPTVISTDRENPPDIIAIIASSAAVVVSDIPFEGPVGAVRVCYRNNEFVINPTFQQIKESQLEIIVAGTSDGITMVEGGANEVSEEIMLEAIDKASIIIKQICDAQKELGKIAGKEKLPINKTVEELPNYKAIWDYAFDQYKIACFLPGKIERNKAKASVKNSTSKYFQEKNPGVDFKAEIYKVFEDLEYKILRDAILEENKRSDGRKNDEVRAITCELGILPRTHGSALFTRGETQALVVTTLGSANDEQVFDDIDGDRRYNNFMLHYNFPPFCVGEKGSISTGRREIGHGSLAMKSVEAIIPNKEVFPYTIRVVSEILESNGSSSMATVCGSTLALFDAGVPMQNPVAGIAMGLISQGDKAVILSDILGEEDHFGDMDFKVAGTENGITGFQMDIKISNVTPELMKKALEQAKRGRLHILEAMKPAMSGGGDGKISDYAPQILTMTVDADKKGVVIGSGGKTIKGISEKTESSINIDDKGKIVIFGKNREKAEEAKKMILALIEEPEVGRVYNGIVKRILEFGAFIEILPGKEGLCHISKLSFDKVNAVTDVLKEEQELPVKLMEVDRMGRINLSHIDAIDPELAEQKRQQAREEGGDREPRNHDRDRDRDRGRDRGDFRRGSSGRRHDSNNNRKGGFFRRDHN